MIRTLLARDIGNVTLFADNKAGPGAALHNNMVPSTDLQCHPCAGATLIFMRACSQRANRACRTPHSLSEGISNQLRDIFYLTDERRFYSLQLTSTQFNPLQLTSTQCSRH